MKTNVSLLLAALLCSLVVPTPAARAQGTAFTYQGRLNAANGPANGSYDLQFAIYDAASGGSKQGSGFLTNSPTAVSNGLFTVTLDFGSGVFPGAGRWLDIAVRTNGGGAFTILAPRQALTPTPYAITAGNLSGPLPLAQLPVAVVTNGAGGVNLAGTFTGNGAGVTNVNAVTLNGIPSGNFWQLGGNNVSAGQFLGSTNNQAVEMRANDARVLRLEPTADAPNIIGGAGINYIAPGVEGATIAGGGSIATYSAGYSNRVESFHGTVGGGLGNWIQTNAIESTIAGGNQNTILANGSRGFIGGGLFNAVGGDEMNVVAGGYANGNFGHYATIGGGAYNAIGSNAVSATVGGGYANLIGAQAYYSAIGGGEGNSIVSNAYDATIAGGYLNTIQAGANQSTIGGGANNVIGLNSYNSTIGGGSGNEIRSNTFSATIGGGEGNMVLAGATYATIGGGVANSIQSNAFLATIGGGAGNVILANSYVATIPGGNNNTATNYAFAAGYRAKAVNSGAFVWADSQNVNFSSTGPNQFLIRAAGGVGINTTNPETNALAVVGDTRLTGLLRSGSEMGTSEAPTPAGLVIRRINSYLPTSNLVVAVVQSGGGAKTYSLIRDGTFGGFQISYPGSPGNVTIACMGMDKTGAQKNFYTGLANPATEGVVQIYTNSQNIVHFECTFGITYNGGEHLTQVTLSRFVSGGASDFFWVGHVISTYNQ